MVVKINQVYISLQDLNLLTIVKEVYFWLILTF